MFPFTDLYSVRSFLLSCGETSLQKSANEKRLEERKYSLQKSLVCWLIYASGTIVFLALQAI